MTRELMKVADDLRSASEGHGDKAQAMRDAAFRIDELLAGAGIIEHTDEGCMVVSDPTFCPCHKPGYGHHPGCPGGADCAEWCSG